MPTDPFTPLLLTVDQAADALAIKPSFVRRLVQERRIPFVRLGRYVRLEPAELQTWVETHRVAVMSWRANPGRVWIAVQPELQGHDPNDVDLFA